MLVKPRLQLNVVFGETSGARAHADGLTVCIANRVLGGAPSTVFPLESPMIECGEGHWKSVSPSGRFGWGVFCLDVTPLTLEATTRSAFAALFRSVSPHGALYRVWNFVPRINAVEHNQLENYQAFCRGRALAFEDCFHEEFEARIPAASAVGTPGDKLIILYLFGADDVSYVENPDQVPAYHYPPRYGPKPPSFARGSVVRNRPAATPHSVFVSGTSSIKGSESVFSGQTMQQLEVTLDNLRMVGEASEANLFKSPLPAPRSVRVYLRDGSDFEAVNRRLQDAFLFADDDVSFLEADICRSDLNVEIEVSMIAPS